MSSTTLVILLVAVVVLVTSVRNSRVTWSSAMRHPVLNGAGIGLASGWLVSIWVAERLGSGSALFIIGIWFGYTLSWIAVLALLANTRRGASIAT